MATVDWNRPSSSEDTVFFFPPFLDSVKRHGKRLRKLRGKEALSLSHSYDLAARLCGYGGYTAIRQAYLSNHVRLTVWDHELNESQLHERRRVQAQVLMTGMQICEEDALHILEVGSFSARKANVVDEQSLPEETCARVCGRAISDAGDEPASTPGVQSTNIDGPATTEQINQVKVVYRKRRQVQKGL
ncbi:hypothetical protein [Caballeronia sp. BCC1704]|uniref:hypothetical protein n=1 Tax=Caballeronia sp. BCC1704 TaxID=2676300 RepID=UPI00158A1314|nr:hypothetical protein [Caballeronia sp. BCC1704]